MEEYRVRSTKVWLPRLSEFGHCAGVCGCGCPDAPRAIGRESVPRPASVFDVMDRVLARSSFPDNIQGTLVWSRLVTIHCSKDGSGSRPPPTPSSDDKTFATEEAGLKVADFSVTYFLILHVTLEKAFLCNSQISCFERFKS